MSTSLRSDVADGHIVGASLLAKTDMSVREQARSYNGLRRFGIRSGPHLFAPVDYHRGIRAVCAWSAGVTDPAEGQATESAGIVNCELLVAAMARGEEEALSQLYESTIGRVFGLARTITGNTEDAEEVACDVFTIAWDRAAQFDPKRGAAIAWLLVTCRSRALDLLRRRRSRREPAGGGCEERPEPSTPDLLAAMDEAAQVRRALSALPEQQRQLIGLAFFGDMSHADIARMLDLPLGTVKSHIRRGLAAMRREME